MRSASFGENLKAARKNRGLTQKQLGELTGAGQVVVANYERGARFPGEEMLRKLAEALGVSLDYLLSVPQLKGQSVNVDFQGEDLFSLLLSKPVADSWYHISHWMDKGELDALQVYTRILIPLLEKAGALWASGEISIVDEHIISGKVRELITLTAVREKSWSSPPYPGLSWMGLCAPGEEHDLVLLMTSCLFRLRNWDVRYIGTGTPVHELIQSIEVHKPLVLSISVTMKSLLSGLEAYLEAMNHRKTHTYGIILGGAAVAEQEVVSFPGVVGVAHTLEEGVVLAEEYAIEKRSSR